SRSEGPVNEVEKTEPTFVLPLDVSSVGPVWAMVESSPDGMLLVDDHGKLVLVNHQIESMFGYDRSELIGSSVDCLLPERFRERHEVHRKQYRVAPEPRAMGTELNLWGHRKDGSEFPVEVSLSPIDTAQGAAVVATVRDVSDRHNAEAEVHAVLHTVNSARDGVFMFDPGSLCFTFVNQGAVKQLGYTRDELLSMTPLDIKPEFTETSFREVLRPLLTGEEDSCIFTTVHRRSDSVDVPVEIVLEYPEAAANGRPRRLVALVRDISERLEAVRAREASELAFRTAFEAAPVGMAIVDFSDPELRRITRVNRALCDLLGYEPEELLGMGFAQLTHPDDTPESDEWAFRVNDGVATRFAMEKRYVRANGQDIWVWIHAAVMDESQDPTTVLVHVADLTEARKARRDEARLRILEDRARLAEDLHDLIIQRLFAAGMGLQSLQAHLTDAIAKDRLQGTVDELDRAITDMRSAIFRLHSPAVTGTQGDIESTIEAIVPSLGFRPSLEMIGDPDVIPGMVVEQLLPALSDGLTNVSRHADAQSVTVQICVNDHLVMTIADDGIGVDPDAAHGHGLKNLRSRAERVGGTASLTNANDSGAVLTWQTGCF
ncbi:MAG: PAS domain S-box protein, partial [Acidimicrobiales bacterium]